MEKFREELMGKARKEADSLKLDAQRAIAEERAKAVAELKAESAKLSIAIAEKLLGEKLDDAKHQALANQFVQDLGKKQTPQA
jgi:F-type H+-transporting ATPase subunit b